MHRLHKLLANSLLASTAVIGVMSTSEWLSAQPSEPSPLQVFAADPFDNPFGFSYVSGIAKQKILERFGDPIRIESSQYQDRTSDQINTGYVFYYNSLKLVVHENEAQNWSWLETTEITGNEHKLKFGLQIGSTREEVLAALKEPSFLDYEDTLRFVASVTQDGHDFDLELDVEYDASGSVTKFVIANYED